MATVDSDGENEFRARTSISKRFKFPKKFYDDSSLVNPASVPKKLRSATRKRGYEVISQQLPENKRENHAAEGIVLPGKDGLKKSKLNKEIFGSEECLEGPITKEEEEVAEVLYALAGMFPSSAEMDKTELADEPLEAKSSVLPEAASPTFAVAKDKGWTEIVHPKGTSGNGYQLTSVVEPSRVVKIQSLNEMPLPDISISKHLFILPDRILPGVNNSTMDHFSKSEHHTEQISCNSDISNVFPELGLVQRVKLSSLDERLTSGGKPGMLFEPVSTMENIHKPPQFAIQHSINKGLSLQPDSSSIGSHCSEAVGPSQESTNVPPGLGNTAIANAQASKNSAIAEGRAQTPAEPKKSWKKCLSHVHIGRLIKELQITQGKDNLQMQLPQLTINNGRRQAACIPSNTPSDRRIDLNEAVSIKAKGSSSAEKDSTEVRNAILLHQKLSQKEQQASATSGSSSAQKQSQGDLAFPAQCCGVEDMALLPFPYLESRNHSPMPFPQGQTRYSSTALPDHPSAAAAHQVLLQPYFGSSLCGSSHKGVPVLPKQLQEQQQKILNAQLTTQFKPSGIAATFAPGWQNGGLDSISQFQFTQSLFRPSYSSLETTSAKYTPVSPQHQQFVTITSSLPPSSVKRQYHLPSGYEGNGRGIYTNNTTSLQLL